MDDSNEHNLETNWVFVEEVDIAEEALTLNPSNDNLITEIDSSSRSSFENISKSCSDSQLLLHEDNYKCLDKQNIDHDSESDGLSIISNWSYSQSTPDIENSDDGVDDKITDETLIAFIEEKQFLDEKIETNDVEIQNVGEQKTNCVDDGIEETQHAISYLNEIVNDDISYNLIEEIQDSIDSDHEASDQDEAEASKENEDEEPLIYPSSSGEPIFHYDPDLLEQLRWLEELPDDLPDNTNENILKHFLMSKIPQCVTKHFSVSGFLIGTVLIAASSVFLGTYFTASEPIQEELPSYQEKVFLYDVPGEENFEVPTALSFCREKHKSDNIYMEINAQKCLSKIEKRMKRKKYEKIVKEKIKSWEQKLEAKEKFLFEKEKSLKKRQAFSSNENNYNSNHQRTNMRKCNKSNSKQKSREHNERKKYKDDSKEKTHKDEDRKEDKYSTLDDLKLKQSEYKIKERKYKDDSKIKKYKDDDKNGDKYSTSDDFKHKQSEHKNKERKYKDDSKEKIHKDDIKHKEFAYKSKERKCYDDSKEKVNNKKGDEFSTVGDIKQKQLESRHNEEKYKDDSKETLYKDNIRKDYKYKKTDDYKKSKEIQQTNKIKSNQYYEFYPKESSKEKTRAAKENACRSKTECKNSKNKYKHKLLPIVLVDRKNETVDGDWFGKLFKGRSEIRGKESTGEWYFDRSSYRKRKRDKAKWYFDWMMDREILRYRRLYLNL